MGKGSSGGGSAGKSAAGKATSSRSGIGYSAMGLGPAAGGKGGKAPYGAPGIAKTYNARSSGIEGRMSSGYTPQSAKHSKYEIAREYSKLSISQKGDYSPINQMYISLAGGKGKGSKSTGSKQKMSKSRSAQKSKNIETLIRKAG